MACPAGVDEQVWTDFLQHRQAKRSPLTATALAGIVREADKAGITLAAALAVCCERGWTGFRADWHVNATPAAKPAGRTFPRIDDFSTVNYGTGGRL